MDINQITALRAEYHELLDKSNRREYGLTDEERLRAKEICRTFLREGYTLPALYEALGLKYNPTQVPGWLQREAGNK